MCDVAWCGVWWLGLRCVGSVVLTVLESARGTCFKCRPGQLADALCPCKRQKIYF